MELSINNSPHASVIMDAIKSGGAAHSMLAASWSRSAIKYGLDPEKHNSQDLLSDNELHHERQKHGDLLNLASPILEKLFDSVGQVGCTVVLTAADGLIIESLATASEQKFFNTVRLTKGANWSEAIEGTNGIGTCIAETRALTIFRDQHFYTNNTSLSCTDAPIRDHRGNLMAALNISTCHKDHNEGMVNLFSVLVNEAAAKIESKYFCNAFSRARIIKLDNDYNSLPALIATDSDDLILGATRAARRLYGIDDAMIARNIPASDILNNNSEDFNDSERKILRQALSRTDGNVAMAARNLGIGRATFYRRMKRTGLI